MSTKTKRFKVYYKIAANLPETFVILDTETMDEAWDAARNLLKELGYPNGRIERIEEFRQ